MSRTTNCTIDKLQAIVDAQVGKGGVKNLVVALQTFDRGVDFVSAAGISNPETGAPMRPETPYFIASVTKMFTAAVVMQLHHGKQIDLDAPLGRYLPMSLTQGIHVLEGVDYSDQIRVRDLISQTSGLPDYETEHLKGSRSVLDELIAGNDRPVSTEEAIQIVRTLSPHFPPGSDTRAYYSNANFRLLGAIIETVTGSSMATCFQQRICAPLGLTRTYLFEAAKNPPDEPPATLYVKNTPANVGKYLSSNTSDGGLVSTASEGIIFLRAFFDGQLFDKALLQRMCTWKRLFFPLRYGYGLMCFQLPRFVWPSRLPELMGHSGTTGSFAFTCPSRSLYLAGTVNQVAPSKPYFLAMQLVRALA